MTTTELQKHADKIATLRNATNWKPQDRLRSGWKQIQLSLNISRNELMEIRQSRQYALILAQEIVWAAKNNLNFPHSAEKAFGIDKHTAEFLWELRLYAHDTEKTESLINNFQPKNRTF